MKIEEDTMKIVKLEILLGDITVNDAKKDIRKKIKYLEATIQVSSVGRENFKNSLEEYKG